MGNPPTTFASKPPKTPAPASGAATDGVLLLNLGGPETLADVRPFLYRLFSDPEIIRIKNAAARRALAWAVSRLRAEKSRGLYRQIGGGSPLRRITEAQGEALAAKLTELGTPARVYVGMLCWKPFIDEALFERILSDGVSRLCALPLFPQYSDTTTGACLRRVRERAAGLAARRGPSWKIAISPVREWYGNPLYVEAMADLVEAGLERFPGAGRGGEAPHIFYSAHSLPEKYVAAGDPYLDQVKDCVTRINGELGERLSARGVPMPGCSLGFQSKVGPVKWLSPSAEDVLRDLARRGAKRVLAVPVSFVSDHVETLQELDIAYKNSAAELGIAEFRRAAAPNLHPRFIAALADVVRKALPAPCA
ncbi:MAG: ferrochelatase [Acidobacteriota bacterium]|jgi:ferrochelatase|nr:ferrochelatase [Acidobacteriota bacterium]